MGILKPDVGYSRSDGETRLKQYGKAVTVISLAQADAALSAAENLCAEITLISAPDAAASVGPGWFDAVVTLATSRFPAAKYIAILDCGNAPGDALAALRHGIKFIRYCGAKQAAITEIAKKYGANVVQTRPKSLDLSDAEGEKQDPITACCSWLSS